ncbi:unnamed protein product [Linum trigynum]|uniref:CCHC-type domain-containing protein n=1 Tax=Linum trigynum TaxID=586398 RepID=A0AAV2D5P4_9ROSI
MLKGAKSSDCFKIAREGIQALCEKLDMVDTGNVDIPGINRPKANEILLDPLQVKAKGLGAKKSKRKKGEPRQCSNCGEWRHYRTRCPHPVGYVKPTSNGDAPNDGVSEEGGGGDDTDVDPPTTQDQSETVQKRRQKHCSKCGSTNHNARTCTGSGASDDENDDDENDNDDDYEQPRVRIRYNCSCLHNAAASNICVRLKSSLSILQKRPVTRSSNLRIVENLK